MEMSISDDTDLSQLLTLREKLLSELNISENNISDQSNSSRTSSAQPEVQNFGKISSTDKCDSSGTHKNKSKSKNVDSVRSHSSCSSSSKSEIFHHPGNDGTGHSLSCEGGNLIQR